MTSLKANESWTTTVSCSDAELKSSSTLEVKALVNDIDWMIGSNHHVQVVGKATISDSFYPWFYTSKGTTTIISKVYSKELGNYRDVIFYLPPSFHENTLKPYKNVLIMHDGQNLFNPKTSAFGTAWMAQDTLDQSIVTGKSDEVIVAGPYNTNDRNNEYTYVYDESEKCGGKGDLYLDWIESTLVPLIKSSNFRAEVTRDKLGILGSSLGGLISCYAGWTRPTVYGKVGCMSSSFWWADQDFQNKLLPNTTVPALPHPHIYMDAGTSGSLGGEAQCSVYTGQVYDVMVADGFVANEEVQKYVDVGGQHNEASWGARFYLPVQFLYGSNTV